MMKRLLAFAACSTVAILLLIRILPELTAGPNEMPRQIEPEVQSKQMMGEVPVEKVANATALLLPPPPIVKATSAPKAEPVSAAAESILEEKTAVNDTAPPLNEKAEAPVKTKAFQEEPLPQSTISSPPKPKQRPAAQPLKEPAQRVAAVSLDPVPQKSLLEPAQRSTSSARSNEEAVAPGPTIVAEGRVLLRILEHGSGPVVEIAWPLSGTKRRALYRLFEACYGMEVALIDVRGELYARAGEAGRPWQPNMDRYSGFVRQPTGHLTPDEQDIIARIRNFHGGLRSAENVRLFPRRLDAVLLGSLKLLVGEGYSGGATIHAQYRRDGKNVLVENIRMDNRAIPGRIDLSSAARQCRSGSWS